MVQLDVNSWLLYLLVFIGLCSCTIGEQLLVCGDDQVLLIHHLPHDQDSFKIKWHWRAGEARDLPGDFKKHMVPTDDCKPVDRHKKILVTSSGGGVVLIDRKSKRSLFHAYVPNAHSAAMLPGNRIVVALSTAVGGNALEVYDLNNPAQCLYRDSLYSGHGVVWLPKEQRLYALGFDQLRAYSLANWSSDRPALVLDKMWSLPDESGHDLFAVSDDCLLLTTHGGAWRFDIPSQQFSPFEPLHDVPDIKSIYFKEETSRLIYTKGEISWWSHHVYCTNPNKVISIPGVRLYKVRVLE